MTASPARPQTDRRVVVESFAQTLSDIRQQAGQPSFRQMSQTSGCISHATLHEATRGKRLPTWETTEQFLIACGVDPRAGRDEWCRADRLVNRRAGQASSTASETPTSHALPVAPAAKSKNASRQAGDETDPADERETAPMRMSTRSKHVAQRWVSPSSVAGTLLAAVLLVVGGFVAADWTRSAPASTATSPSAAPSTAPTTTPSPTPTTTPPTIGSVKCPRAGSPEVRYWSAAHRDDFALEYRASAKRPLCSTVPAGKKVEVGFTLTNRGTASVSGLRLHMVRATGSCFDGEPRDTKLAVLRPNKSYMMSFEFASLSPGECSAEFEVRDRDGKRVFAEGETVPFAIVIA